MKSIGFVISTKENENRRAIVPEDIRAISYPGQIYIEHGYGTILNIPDSEYREAGAHICTKEEALNKDIICDPKVGDASYLKQLKEGQAVFGWIHATQNRDITDALIERHLTAYAWEKMFEKGRHIFWFNNELAGEAAVIHAFQCFGTLPYGLRVAVIGNGNTARGATRVLNMLGASVMQYNRGQEGLLHQELPEYDAIVNCVLWDVRRKDHIITKQDLPRMKRGAMIIDVSCDRNGGIETCIPTTIERPAYYVDHVFHYAVDHTPSIFYKTFTYQNSKVISSFVEQLINGNIGDVLSNCMIIKNGEILDREIVEFQQRDIKYKDK